MVFSHKVWMLTSPSTGLNMSAIRNPTVGMVSICHVTLAHKTTISAVQEEQIPAQEENLRVIQAENVAQCGSHLHGSAKAVNLRNQIIIKSFIYKWPSDYIDYIIQVLQLCWITRG